MSLNLSPRNEHAEQWRALARAELERLTWDKHAVPTAVRARAATYEAAARSIELTDETGKFHCACHLRAVEDLEREARLKADPIRRR